MSVVQYRNRLLQSLSKKDRSALTPYLEPVELGLRQSIEKPDTPITEIYFPESGIISVVARFGDRQIEVGLIGREGMSGTAVLLGDQRSPNEVYVQMAGAAHRISAKPLRHALQASKTLSQLLQRYAQAFLVQVAQTAFANGTAVIDARLARWLLMAHDRHDDDELPLTHESIAVMLGVRRPGVTDALHKLEGKGLIKAERGIIRIVRRKGLIALAGGSYGVAEAEYERLIG
jgi:CRP-like cAMP-binding protein